MNLRNRIEWIQGNYEKCINANHVLKKSGAARIEDGEAPCLTECTVVERGDGCGTLSLTVDLTWPFTFIFYVCGGDQRIKNSSEQLQNDGQTIKIGLGHCA